MARGEQFPSTLSSARSGTVRSVKPKQRKRRPAPAGPIPIEIFRAGRHVDMSGRSVSFSEDDLARIARRYDPAVHEAPIVIGHPRHDAPAYGWVAGVRAKGPSMFAAVDQVHADFAEGVRSGAYKKVSASFYLPNAPGNPKPGDYYLRHVGFLGAQPPSVKGLEPVAFADGPGDSVTIEFAELDTATLFRSLREWLIEEFGIEKADKALPPGLVDWVQEDAAVQDAAETTDHAEAAEAAVEAVSEAVTETVVEQCAEAATKAVIDAVVQALTAAFAELDADKVRETVTAALGAPSPGEGEAEGDAEASTVIEAALEAVLEEALEEPVHAAVEEALAEAPASPTSDHAEPRSIPRRHPQLLARERELARRERRIRAREQQIAREAHVAFAEQLAKEGRRVPCSRSQLVDLLMFASDDSVNFSEPAKGKVKTPADALRAILRRLPQEVHFEEVAAGELTFGEHDDPRAVGAAAREYIDQQAAKGITVSPSEAVRYVKGMKQ